MLDAWPCYKTTVVQRADNAHPVMPRLKERLQDGRTGTKLDRQTARCSRTRSFAVAKPALAPMTDGSRSMSRRIAERIWSMASFAASRSWDRLCSRHAGCCFPADATGKHVEEASRLPTGIAIAAVDIPVLVSLTRRLNAATYITKCNGVGRLDNYRELTSRTLARCEPPKQPPNKLGGGCLASSISVSSSMAPYAAKTVGCTLASSCIDGIEFEEPSLGD